MFDRRHQAKGTRSAAVHPSPFPGEVWIAGLGATALAISLYLLWGWWQGEHLPGCGPNSGCDAVLGSRWSTWLRVPVSLLAVLTYASLLGGLFALRRAKKGSRREQLKTGLAALGIAILGAAAWFVVLQLVVLRAICPYCMLAHACGLGVGVFTLRATRGASGFRTATAMGVSILLVLLSGQLLYQRPGYQVSAIPAATVQTTGGVETAEPASEVAAAESSPPTAPAQRWLQLHDGLFRLDLQAVPLIGSPDAPHVVLHFFDYSCEHCRALHPLLSQVQHTLKERLAIVNLPIPLNPDCNPIMKRVIPKHINACAYARLALAVWRADRTQLEDFEDWIFALPSPPDTEAARGEAARRVGGEALGKALQDPWIDEYLALGIRIYHTNYLRFSKSQLPLLMTTTNLVSGAVRSTNDLYRVLGLEL